MAPEEVVRSLGQVETSPEAPHMEAACQTHREEELLESPGRAGSPEGQND